MRQFLVVTVVVLLGPGCYPLLVPMANSTQAKWMKDITARGPEVAVVRPELLASVRSVAVPPFHDSSWQTGESLEVYRDEPGWRGRMFFLHKLGGEQFAERFEEMFLSQRVLDVVERSRLAAVFDEQVLGPSPRADPRGEMLPEISAGLAGADAVLLGSTTAGYFYIPDRIGVYQFGYFSIHIRVIDTRSGQILAYGSDSVGEAADFVDEQTLITLISKRLTQLVSDAVLDARKKFPNQAPPETAPFMRVPSRSQPAEPTEP